MLSNLGKQIQGALFFLNLDNENRFSKCYLSLDAIKRGFLEGCRPVICLDGCHLKTKFGGQLLVAVGMDPNDYLFLSLLTLTPTIQ
jgi:hypothetical protein